MLHTVSLNLESHSYVGWKLHPTCLHTCPHCLNGHDTLSLSTLSHSALFCHNASFASHIPSCLETLSIQSYLFLIAQTPGVVGGSAL